MSRKKVEAGFNVPFTADQLVAVLVKQFKPACDLYPDAWDSVRLIDDQCDARFPVPLHQCTLFERRYPVVTSIYAPSRRNELVETLTFNPETVFIVKDPNVVGMDGVFLVMATSDPGIPGSWLACMEGASRMVLGWSCGFRLVGVPLSSFV